jgi:peptidoglycan/xylan/chitin deacetylase (PgdA/CDA1 family)
MAKENRRHSKKFIILELLLLLVLIGSIVVYFTFNNKKKELEKKNKEINTEYKEKQKEYDEKEKELSSIEEKIKSYDNLDEKINNAKKEYFNTIKKLEDTIIAGTSDKKIAYLTFDDGPYYNTYKVFDILDKYDVKATFFLTNINGEYCFDKKSENCYALYKEYLKRGHTIANHTFTHAIFKGLYTNPNTFMDAVNKQHEHIKEQTGGYITNILRFPGGIPTAKAKLGSNGFDQATQMLREKGYGWVDWTAENGDGKDIQNKTQAWSMLKSYLNDNIEVILFHDYNNITTSMLPEVIEYLRNNGYILLPLFYESNMINK